MLLKGILKPIKSSEISKFQNLAKMRFHATLLYKNWHNSLNFWDIRVIVWKSEDSVIQNFLSQRECYWQGCTGASRVLLWAEEPRHPSWSEPIHLTAALRVMLLLVPRISASGSRNLFCGKLSGKIPNRCTPHQQCNETPTDSIIISVQEQQHSDYLAYIQGSWLEYNNMVAGAW